MLMDSFATPKSNKAVSSTDEAQLSFVLPSKSLANTFLTFWLKGGVIACSQGARPLFEVTTAKKRTLLRCTLTKGHLLFEAKWVN